MKRTRHIAVICALALAATTSSRTGAAGEDQRL